jgi:hypothetical protein
VFFVLSWLLHKSNLKLTAIISFMNIERPWAFWRRIQYGAGFTTFCSLVGTLIYFGFFYTPANCFDGFLNNNELGVDCGGSCTLICPFTVIPPKVVWAEVLKL